MATQGTKLSSWITAYKYDFLVYSAASYSNEAVRIMPEKGSTPWSENMYICVHIFFNYMGWLYYTLIMKELKLADS